jgi:hypothetical protein
MPKRNAHGAGSIRQRPDGRWEARYSTGRDPGTGKQIQRSVYGATQAEVQKQLVKVLAAQESGTYVVPDKMTVSTWCDVWLTEYLGGVKSSTVATYDKNIRNHIKPALGAIALQKLTAHMVQGFYNRMQKEKNLSPKTVKCVHGVLHAALKKAVSIGYVKHNVADNAALPRIERREMKVMQDADINAFFNAIQDHRYETVYYVTLFTGLRQSEALGMTWDCLDFKRGTMTVTGRSTFFVITSALRMYSFLAAYFNELTMFAWYLVMVIPVTPRSN